MAAPVWVLSVDLQTKTATFQSGMAEAARSARGAFTEIKSGSESMGSTIGRSTGSARQSVMLLGDEFGIHLPRGLTTFIASLGPFGAAMEAAFPFVAIALGATLLLEHLSKLRAAGVALTQEQINFGTAANNAFRSLDEKLLSSQIRSDELRNNHLGALKKELQLINLQTLDQLSNQFAEVAQKADAAFKQLETSWYSFKRGSAGAKASLDEFGVQYRKFLSEGNDSGAANLLANKLQREQHILETMRQMEQGRDQSSSTDTHEAGLLKFNQAQLELKRMNVDLDHESVESMETLVNSLQEQAGLAQRIAATKATDSDNARTSTAKAKAAQDSGAAKEAAESQLRMAELAIASDRATADSLLTITRGSADDREAVDVAFADRELAVQLAANQKQIAAVDRMADGSQNALKALHDKALELTAQHESKLSEITAKANIERAAATLQQTEQSEREKIEATLQGSAARIAAISQAIKAEEALGLQDTSFYRDLLTQRVEATRQAAQEEAKERAQAGALMAEYDEKMGALSLAAQKEHQSVLDSSRRMTDQQKVAEAVNAANQEYALQLTATAHQIAALDKGGKDYNNKLLELQNKQKEMIQAHENEVTAIKDKAETERNARILAADKQFNDTLASGMTQVLMGHKSFASQMNSIGNTVVTGMMENALKSVLANDFTKESDAAAAARKAYLTGTSIGGPAGIILGPIMAAAAFANVMAFQGGTDYVPGFGTGDKVPAMLEPGEGVVPGGVMDNLRKMASSGGMGGGHTYHVSAPIHLHASALDAEGMDKIMDKHSPIIQKHFEATLRRMNH